MNQIISHSYPGFDDTSIESAVSAMRMGDFSGRQTMRLAEGRLASFMGVAYSKLTNTGFAALQAALVASNVNHCDNVIIPTVTCPSVYHAVRSIGVTPIVVDVEKDKPLISFEQAIRKKSTNGKNVVIIPQMFGLTQDVKLFYENDFLVIEDIAQRFSPSISPYAELTVMSFSPTKLFTMGYGGGIVARQDKYHSRLSVFLDPDHAEYSYDHEIPFRIHSPVSDYQCAMLISQLERYQKIINYRSKLVEKYDQELGYPARLQPEVPFRYQLVLEYDSANKVAAILRESGIGAWALGSQLLHQLFGIEGNYENAEWWSNRVLSLPLHEKLTLDNICYISDVVRRYR
ncbi:DegT/DnrJ/EryC1/StrS family aminotransferase [Brevibacillus choshinensis]|uniref:DegT/DnrJ/EryC1/StrS family aminotransferase n=1 Tax=Brevibacillus choshinensis TaxID=54911 RepID=UPI002E1A1FD5|nr:DegT/DnrJ/EryC1/StrS family aminotransferase [Brevibacillus choshinensis]